MAVGRSFKRGLRSLALSEVWQNASRGAILILRVHVPGGDRGRDNAQRRRRYAPHYRLAGLGQWSRLLAPILI